MEEIRRGWALFHETIVNVIIPSTIQSALQIRQRMGILPMIFIPEDAIV